MFHPPFAAAHHDHDQEGRYRYHYQVQEAHVCCDGARSIGIGIFNAPSFLSISRRSTTTVTKCKNTKKCERTKTVKVFVTTTHSNCGNNGNHGGPPTRR